jgi:hypothetical protein
VRDDARSGKGMEGIMCTLMAVLLLLVSIFSLLLSWLMPWATRAEVGPIALQWHSETAVDTDHAIMILCCAYVTPEHLLHQSTMTIEAQL